VHAKKYSARTDCNLLAINTDCFKSAQRVNINSPVKVSIIAARNRERDITCAN